MNTTFIYGLIDPRTTALKYVGKSNNPQLRFTSVHLNDVTKTPKVNWIKNLRKENLIPELFIIDEVNELEWQFWEQFYIAYFKSIGCKLTNCAIGGEGWHNQKHSEATKEKLRRAHLGK